MFSKTKAIILILVLGLGLTTGFLSSQSRQNQVLTSGGNFVLWEFNPQTKSFEKTWENLPLAREPQQLEKWKRNKVPNYNINGFSNRLQRPCFIDLDKDGENELIAIDRYGIIIYGKKPRYLAFSSAGAAGSSHQILAADVTGDGKTELVTLRILPSSGQFNRTLMEIWEIRNDNIKILWERTVNERMVFVLLFADADNDGSNELITASDSIYIWKSTDRKNWDITAKLPIIGGQIDVVRIIDIDGDGKNEILATGSSHALSIFKHRKDRITQKDSYPILWQTPNLLSDELKSDGLCNTQGLAVMDINGNGIPEILVGTTEYGEFEDGSRTNYNRGGIIHIYEYENNILKEIWTSDWTYRASIPAFVCGDLDNDGGTEFMYNARDIYEFDIDTHQYRKKGVLPSRNTSQAIMGSFGLLNEPVESLRIVPIKWNLPIEMTFKTTWETPLMIRTVWAAAKNVTVRLHTDESYIKIENGFQKLGNMKSGESLDSLPFVIKIGTPDEEDITKADEEMGMIFSQFWIDITADGDYKQSIPVIVGLDLPKNNR